MLRKQSALSADIFLPQSVTGNSSTPPALPATAGVGGVVGIDAGLIVIIERADVFSFRRCVVFAILVAIPNTTRYRISALNTHGVSVRTRFSCNLGVLA
jgi:hypothetical protein